MDAKKKQVSKKNTKIVRISENKLVEIIENIIEGQKTEWLAEQKKKDGDVLAERVKNLEDILKKAKVVKKSTSGK